MNNELYIKGIDSAEVPPKPTTKKKNSFVNMLGIRGRSNKRRMETTKRKTEKQGNGKGKEKGKEKEKRSINPEDSRGNPGACHSPDFVED